MHLHVARAEGAIKLGEVLQMEHIILGLKKCARKMARVSSAWGDAWAGGAPEATCELGLQSIAQLGGAAEESAALLLGC